MARRNAQDSLNAATLQWELLRNPNLAPQEAPTSRQPQAVARRRNGKVTRVTPLPEGCGGATRARLAREARKELY